MRALLITLLLLVVLVVAADRMAARLAEGELERRASAEAGTAVSADIRGFPFLTQALDRELDRVGIHTRADARLLKAWSGHKALSEPASAVVPAVGSLPSAMPFMVT